MIYRVKYTQGNGYHCGCCRQTWDTYADFETEQEALDYIAGLKRVAANPTPEDIKWDREDVSDFELQKIETIQTF